MKLSTKTGNILTSLILLAILAVGFLYWKTTSEENARAEKRGFVSYEEHLKKKEREKMMKDAQEKVKSFFENFISHNQ